MIANLARLHVFVKLKFKDNNNMVHLQGQERLFTIFMAIYWQTYMYTQCMALDLR